MEKEDGMNKKDIEIIEERFNSIKSKPREWDNYKDVIKGLHDYHPEAIFLTQTKGVLIGWAIRETWKEIWPNEKLPKFFTVNPGHMKYYSAEELNEESSYPFPEEKKRAGLERESNHIASILKKYNVKGSLAVIDDISERGGKTLMLSSEIVDRAREKCGIEGPQGKLSAEADKYKEKETSFHVYSGGIVDSLNYEFGSLARIKPWKREGIKIARGYEESLAAIKKAHKKDYPALKREIFYTKEIGKYLGKAIKEERTEKGIEGIIGGITAIGGIGFLYTLFSKPTITAQNVQLAPPFPNFMMYIFLAMLIGGAAYFLAKKLIR